MFKKLRHRFVVISLILVGLIVAISLTTLVLISWQTGLSNLESMLSDTLAQNDVSEAGPLQLGTQAPADYTTTPVVVVHVDGAGNLSYESNADVVASPDAALRAVGTAATESTSNFGTVSEYHVAWEKAKLDDSSWRIAIADTTAIETARRSQIIASCIIFLAALGAMYVIARALAGWALRPAEESWEQQKRFIADASHELKTPLAVILANIDILRSEDKRTGQNNARWIDTTEDEALRMKALVDDLLELARTDNDVANQNNPNAQQLPMSDINFSDLVDNTALQFDAVAFDRECLIDTNIMPDIHIKGYQPQLERLVSILIDNACKYATKGSHIKVCVGKTGDHAVFTVNNDGAPISEKELPHVFERFWRSDEVRTKSSTGGYGLGLAIAKGIVDVHHGSITVDSTEKDGTTFTVLL